MLFWKKRNKDRKDSSPSNANKPDSRNSTESSDPHRVIIRDASAPRVAPPKKNHSGKPPGGKTLEEA